MQVLAGPLLLSTCRGSSELLWLSAPIPAGFAFLFEASSVPLVPVNMLVCFVPPFKVRQILFLPLSDLRVVGGKGEAC